MYSSTGISLQELLQAQGMLEPDNEDDYVLISSETYGMHVEGLDQPATEVIPELADSEWIRKERLVGKLTLPLSRAEDVSAMFHLVEHDIEQHFASVAPPSEDSGLMEHHNIARMMSNLFDTLILWQSGWDRPLKHLDVLFTAHFHGLLHSYTRSTKFHRYLEIYFRSTLPPLEKVNFNSSSQNSGKLGAAAMKPHKELHRLGYLPRYSSMLVDLAYERIKRLVQSDGDEGGEAGGDEAQDEEEDIASWSRPMLGILRKEVHRQVVAWLYIYINAGNDRDYQRKPNIDARIEYALQSALFERRVRELFDIIVDFPDSQPGLEDIRTKDIISQYVSTIRAVKIVDSSGILLYAIAGPIQEYLKQRRDTISCLVSMLVDGNDLIEAGEDQPDKIKPIQVKHEQAEDWSNPNWDPEPIDAAPEFKSQKASDIISTLVGMYDSRETIVIELQQWLAKRLLIAQDYEVDAEIMEIEKLKLRFGDAALHVCDIMLKDIADSKRTNTRIQSEQRLPVKPKILSHLYWPAIKEPKFRLPKRLQKMQDQYANAYHKFRQDKKLKFYHQGTVVIEVQLQDRRLEVEVTLLQAAVLEAFSKQCPSVYFKWIPTKRLTGCPADRMTLDALTKRLRHKDQSQVQHAADYWVNVGVLHTETDGSFVLLEVSAEQDMEQDGSGDLPRDEPVDLESAEEIRHDLHEKHWPPGAFYGVCQQE
ncbi:hypothetical protein QFC20_002231 [Naganishia adeliensis]|uniref:Uncharacterized protein n=1 Tax=Naganishia adeliensis TaxID=92952 RepID=A0ACC2WLZ9_9TREE|nr:hypothetical protein QFC20_002231 [Naganishia adeliensis]